MIIQLEEFLLNFNLTYTAFTFFSIISTLYNLELRTHSPQSETERNPTKEFLKESRTNPERIPKQIPNKSQKNPERIPERMNP
jgi:hypothetical protein